MRQNRDGEAPFGDGGMCDNPSPIGAEEAIWRWQWNLPLEKTRRSDSITVKENREKKRARWTLREKEEQKES